MKRLSFKVKVKFSCPSCHLNPMPAIEKQPPALFRAQGCRPCRTKRRAWCDFLPYKQCCLKTIKIALAQGLRSWFPWFYHILYPGIAPCSDQMGSLILLRNLGLYASLISPGSGVTQAWGVRSPFHSPANARDDFVLVPANSQGNGPYSVHFC